MGRRPFAVRRWLYTLPLRMRSLFTRARVEQELAEELGYHVEEKTREQIGRGLDPGDARRRALMDLGGIEQTKEACRDTRRVAFLENLLRDTRYGARTLRRAPAFTSIVVLTLGLGIGANTAIFSLINGILLRPLPHARPEQLVSVTGSYPRGAFAAMRDQIRTMDVAAYVESRDLNLSGLGVPVRLSGAEVSAELLSILGAQPALGRTFVAGEDGVGRDRLVVLAHAVWQRQLGGDPLIIGRPVVLGGVSREVIGVMPADFTFPSAATQFWIPLHNEPENPQTYWAGDFMPVIGRLRPGSSIAAAQAEIHEFQARVPALFPWTMPATWNTDVGVVPLREGMVADVRSRLLVLMAAVALVLLIACANVANLALARAATRQKEIGIRSALGAGPARIARLLLTENLLLGILGGIAGLGVAGGGLSLLVSALPPDTPRLASVHLDWPVLAFTAALSLLTGLVFGLVPATRLARTTLWTSLEAAGRDASFAVPVRLRRALVIAEVALAVLLVTSAGLLIRTLWSLAHVNPGFRPDQVVTARISPNEPFCADSGRCLSFYQTVLDRIAHTPGVNGAALVNAPPLGGRVSKRSVDFEGYVETTPLLWLNIVTPEYFRVMSIPLLAGRVFTAADGPGKPPVAILTAETARRYWGEENPIGRHVRFAGETDWRTVVGVAADVRAYDLRRNVPDFMNGTLYVPYGPRGTLENRLVPLEMTMAVRTTANVSQVDAMLRRTVAELSRDVPVIDVSRMEAALTRAVSTPASTALLFAAFAGVALALGVIGIYGVLSFVVTKRTREIGIRLALGARRRDAVKPVLAEGAWVSTAGLVLGLAAARVATRVLSGQLYGVTPADPATYVAVAGVMFLVTLVACWIPTRRALRVDPLIAMRSE